MSEEQPYIVIHEDEINPEYIIRPKVVGGFVLNLPIRNPDFHKSDMGNNNEDLTTID